MLESYYDGFAFVYNNIFRWCRATNPDLLAFSSLTYINFTFQNKRNTEISLGVNSLGLHIFKLDDKLRPVISFAWSEISHISHTDKKVDSFLVIILLVQLRDSTSRLVFSRTSDFTVYRQYMHPQGIFHLQ